MRGNLIVFEGVDGSGTTTQAEILRKKFSAMGLPAHVTAQPSRGPMGLLIRQILSGRLVTPLGNPPGWSTMSLLFAADRQDQQECEIEPNLREGVTVICDRYLQSSAVYQSVSSRRDDTVGWILDINKNIRKPDVVVHLRVDSSTALKRRDARPGPREIFDDLEMQEKLIVAYDRLGEMFPTTRIEVVDGSRPAEEVAADAWRIVEEIRAQGAPI